MAPRRSDAHVVVERVGIIFNVWVEVVSHSEYVKLYFYSFILCHKCRSKTCSNEALRLKFKIYQLLVRHTAVCSL